MKKKIISAVLLAAMLLPMGCAKEKKVVSGDFSERDMLEITVWNTQGSDYVADSTYETTVVEQWLMDKTKVHVEDVYGNDGGQWDTKLTKLIAGDNMPHIVYCGTGQGAAHFNKLDQADAIWQLTPEILQKYAPDVWKETPQEYWDKMNINGSILGVPFGVAAKDVEWEGMTQEDKDYLVASKSSPMADVLFTSNICLYVRDDILKDFYPEARTYDELVALLEERGEPIGDELLDIPIYTTEDYINFLYKIQEKGYKENGQSVFPYGQQGADSWASLCWLGAEMSGYKGHYYTSTWNRKTERMEIPIAHAMIKEVAKTQNKMIRDKVIDPESLVHTLAQFKEKLHAGVYAVVPAQLPGPVSELNEALKADGKTFRYRPFITQIPSREEYPVFTPKNSWGAAICFTKELSEEELYQVLNWVNTQFTEEYGKVYNWGPEEAGLYEETEDGKLKFKDERYEKTYVEHKTDLLTKEEELQSAGLFSLEDTPAYTKKWNPALMAKYINYTPDIYSGFMFKASSEHVKNVVTNPPCYVWDAVYAEIPEVVKYWGEREQWESKFKLAFAATSDEMFEEKWNDAIKTLNEIVNVDDLEKALTEVAKPLAEELKANNQY